MRTLSILLAIVSLFVISCKKNIKEEKAPPLPTTNSKAAHVEQAFPGLHGETLTTRFHGQEIQVEKKGDRYVWMGDIAFDQVTFDSLNDAASARTFKPGINTTWPSGRVPYIIQAGFTTNELNIVNSAIAHWQANTGLTFVNRTWEGSYIRIRPGASGSGLFADFIGLKGGEQIINLESGGFGPGEVIHEIGHAIGFYHEQSRSDRDQYISVFYNRVTPNTTSNIYQFRKYSETGETGAQLGTFDFNSIMLYSSFAFSDGINPTMTRLDGSPFFAQRSGLSNGDIETASYIYGPPYSRLRYVTVSENGDPYYYEYIRDIYLEFFANPQCTIPATTTINRPFRVHRWFYTYVNGRLNSGQEGDIITSVGAGLHSIYLGQERNYGQEDGQGTTLYQEITSHAIWDGSVR